MEEITYSFDQKEKLARKIQKLKKDKYFIDVFDIILKYNPDINITTNPSGHFMYFQNLKTETYQAIEKYIKKITMGQLISDSNGSTSNKLLSESIKQSSDDETISYNPKLKYSNREKNLMKRKIYDKQLNSEVPTSYYTTSSYSSANTTTDNILQDSDNVNLNITVDDQIVKDENINQSEKIFVKRKKNYQNDKTDHNMTLS